MKSEAEVFAELAALCQSEGYVHALAYLCFRDNSVRYAGEMKAKDMLPMFSPERLIRTEVSTLVGLMIQGEMNWTVPSPQILQEQIDRTDSLLKELHETFLAPMQSAVEEHVKGSGQGLNPMSRGDILREAIFYSGESAYIFQYRDFAPPKYSEDDGWLKANKGFVIAEARAVALVISRLQEEKLMATRAQMAALPVEEWTFLPGFTFGDSEVAERSGLPIITVGAILDAFSLPPSEKNQGFQAIDDFNITNATPLLKNGDDYVLFQSYSLAEAVYDSPFYWMVVDKQYREKAMQNRGRFTEGFCRERLELVFGKDRVHASVDIFESKGTQAGEIDVLVLFGDRAIIVQAKSKRLTLESRRGNDGQIRDDFKKSVQDSYDQGLTCAKRLTDRKFSVVGSDGREIIVPARLKEIYILCVVSDHYPALHVQARQFLKYEKTDVIQPPLVLDVFALDAIAEMLSSPLQLLSYINRRAGYSERIIASHELVILSYHLKHNLWVKSDINLVWIGDDSSVHLDIAMAARREGVNGRQTPDGILTRIASTAVGRIVAEIEGKSDPALMDLGFLLLAISEKAVDDVNRGIKLMAQAGRRDGRIHDISLSFDSGQTGLTIHCTDDRTVAAESRLRDHCARRKYIDKAKSWFGICIHPSDESLRFGLKLEGDWQQNDHMDELTRNARAPTDFASSLESIGKRRKLGRNDPCFCNSGLKYKKCHGK